MISILYGLKTDCEADRNKEILYNKNNNYYNCMSLPVKNCNNCVLLNLFVMKTRGLFYPNEEQTSNTIYMTLLKTIISIILFYM